MRLKNIRAASITMFAMTYTRLFPMNLITAPAVALGARAITTKTTTIKD